MLHLADLSAPRLGTRDRPDESWAFEARDYLRSLVVGKEVTFSVSYTINTVSPPLEFGLVYVPSPSNDDSAIDVAAELVKAGWARVRENKRVGDEESEEGVRRSYLRDLEEEAKRDGRGVWNGERDSEKEREVDYTMPSDPNEFLQKYKGKPIDGESFHTLDNRVVLI